MRPNKIKSSLTAICTAVLAIVTMLAAMAQAADVSSTPTAEISALAKSDNAFGFRLLSVLLDDQAAGNVIISPFSVAQALTMIYNGARGATADAMGQTLGIDIRQRAASSADVTAASSAPPSLNPANRSLLAELKHADPKIQLAIANALWIGKDFAVRPAFVRENQHFYDAAVQRLDFSGNPDKAVKTINAWVNRNTRGKIPTILEGLHRDTAMVLTDAVYFKGRWSEQFDPRVTAQRQFHLPVGKTKSVPMMNNTGSYLYMENDQLQAIRLPYGNERLAMYVLLPRKADGLMELARSLNEKKWQNLIDSLDERKGTIMLPKFELRYGELLNSALQSLGMGVAFGNDADFSGISATGKLAISEVQHKTYVKVDEQGTEAAAATAVVAYPTAALSGPKPSPFRMIVDHPFCFVIAERGTGAILFLGLVRDPAA